MIDCSSNAQQNGDSLCSCDAKFAQRIVQTQNHCDVSKNTNEASISPKRSTVSPANINFRAASCFPTWDLTTACPKCTEPSAAVEATSAQPVPTGTLPTTNAVASTPTDSPTTKTENAVQQSKTLKILQSVTFLL